jgi:molecular chaperone HscC
MIIGIDLGTTNSLAAVFKDGETIIIPNRLNSHLTKSVVAIDDNGDILVGDTAWERMQKYPHTAAAVFKRSMGSNKRFKLSGKEYTAEELSSFVLRYLKEDAEAFLGEEVTEAVISVPAYFNDARRKATKRAGELAGLKVERIISEPTAAAISYGIYRKGEHTKFLVFDLGGGTFDISVLELYNNIIEVRAVAGDNFLGGEDFTQVLEQMFLKEHSIAEDTLSAKDRARLRREAEKCKLSYSEGNEHSIKCKINDIEFTSIISEQDYEKECTDLLERIRKPVRKSLTDAKIRLKDVDMVIPVGGATRLPIVQRFMTRLFEQFPRNEVNPDEAVALGAAVQSAIKERNEDVKEVVLTDVCPFTLGTEVSVEMENGFYEPGHYCPIIERNTVIPASRTERLYTVRENQRRISINVLQGESRYAKNNVSLGEIEVKMPRNKAGEEAVDVTYTYDINSILEVEVKIVSTGEKIKRIIKGQELDMTDEEIAKRMEELSYLKIPPREQEANRLVLAKADRLFEELVGEPRIMLEMAVRKFENSLEKRDDELTGEALTQLNTIMKQLEEEYL